MMLLFLAFALSLDAFAASIILWLTHTRSVKSALSIGLVFGGFQWGLFLCGGAAGASILHFIEQWDHIVILIILTYIGGKMIYESTQTAEDENTKTDKTPSLSMLCGLGLATSLDALAAGFSMGGSSTELIMASSIVGIITFLVCLCGFLLSHQLPRAMGKYANLLGGIILCMIGITLFIEHL